MDNKSLIERVFEFQKAVGSKNISLASALSKSTIPFLEYSKSLKSASKKDLMEIKGVGPQTVQYLLRIFQGEDIRSIVEDVPKLENIPKRKMGEHSYDKGGFNGSWDNAVRTYEDS